MAASRRDFFRLGFGAAAGWVASGEAAAGPASKALTRAVVDSLPGGPSLPVETPDLPRLPWTWDGGVKVFHLTPEVVKSHFVPWRSSTPGGTTAPPPAPPSR